MAAGAEGSPFLSSGASADAKKAAQANLKAAFGSKPGANAVSASAQEKAVSGAAKAKAAPAQRAANAMTVHLRTDGGKVAKRDLPKGATLGDAITQLLSLAASTEGENHEQVGVAAPPLAWTQVEIRHPLPRRTLTRSAKELKL